MSETENKDQSFLDKAKDFAEKAIDGLEDAVEEFADKAEDLIGEAKDKAEDISEAITDALNKDDDDDKAESAE